MHRWRMNNLGQRMDVVEKDMPVLANSSGEELAAEVRMSSNVTGDEASGE